MPDFEHGIVRVFTDLVAGLVISYVVEAVLPSMAFPFSVIAILVGIIQIERAKYWGIMYTLGYFLGLLLFGQFFVSSFELLLTGLIILGYLFIKIRNKF